MADPRVVLRLWAIMKLVPLAHATRQHRHLDLQLLADRRTTGLLDPSTFRWPLFGFLDARMTHSSRLSVHGRATTGNGLRNG
ncbi:hypothetical protein B0H11DRAFT_2285187, partial [Mycena galericulata]